MLDVRLPVICTSNDFVRLTLPACSRPCRMCELQGAASAAAARLATVSALAVAWPTRAA